MVIDQWNTWNLPQVAQSKQGKVLASTLPDYVLKNLDMACFLPIENQCKQGSL